jgi:hypothetical protein
MGVISFKGFVLCASLSVLCRSAHHVPLATQSLCHTILLLCVNCSDTFIVIKVLFIDWLLEKDSNSPKQGSQ